MRTCHRIAEQSKDLHLVAEHIRAERSAGLLARRLFARGGVGRGDLNGDGRVDIVTANNHGAFAFTRVARPSE
jgi:hypothetical protein